MTYYDESMWISKYTKAECQIVIENHASNVIIMCVLRRISHSFNFELRVTNIISI